MRNLICIACIACIACNAYGQGKGAATVTTSVHTNKYGQQSTTITTHGTLQTFGPAKTVDSRLPTTDAATAFVGVPSGSGYVATMDGRTWWTGATYGEQDRHRLAMDAIKYHRTIVLRQGGRLVDAIEP